MPAEPKIRVLLSDDHHIVREGIRSSLADYSCIDIVGEAADGRDAVEKTKQLSPDVVLMDLNMPVMGGLEATQIIGKRYPTSKVIALTVHDSQEYVAEILRSGARGYVLKNTSPDELVTAIRSVANGDAFFSPSVSKLMLQQYRGGAEQAAHKLSNREQDVLKLLARGHTNKEVAAKLGIGIRTVETHRARLMRKLQVRNAAELARVAVERRII